MRNRFLHNIRFKVFIMCIESAGMSLLTLLGLYSILNSFKNTKLVRDLINLMESYFTQTQAIIASGVIFFVVYLLILVSGFAKYIAKISNSVSQIAAGNLDAKIDKIRTDELGQLAENINRMSIQLQNHIAEERHSNETKNYLITSLSHDLKTPLTSIYGYLELINNDDYKDEVELRYYTGIAYTKTIQLKKMIEQLFDYAKYNDGNIVCHKVKIHFINYDNMIPIQQQPYIFNKFYKIENGQYDTESSGLGLAIAKTIVELNDGEITVESQDNKTIFTLIFDSYEQESLENL